MVLVGLGVVAAIVVASLPKPIEVDVTQVTRGPLRVTVDAEGQTRVRDRYVITAPLYGNLARIELDPGDDVQGGDVLARITPLEPALLDPRSRAELEARVRHAEGVPYFGLAISEDDRIIYTQVSDGVQEVLVRHPDGSDRRIADDAHLLTPVHFIGFRDSCGGRSADLRGDVLYVVRSGPDEGVWRMPFGAATP